MATLIALYQHPADAAAFDDYYFNKHIPLAKTLPGLRSYRVNAGPVAALGAGTPYHLVALLDFDSMAALQQALVSPEGQAAAADVVNFGQAGVELLVFDTKSV